MVNTFVVEASSTCVAYLDDRRLNKQRVEAKQILDVLELNSTGWGNHPAVLMWQGYTEALKVYINWCIRAWRDRGHHCELNEYEVDEATVVFPWWFFWPELHLTHRISLLRKDPQYYAEYFPLCEEDLPWQNYGYIWPHKMSEEIILAVEADEILPPHLVCDPIGQGAPAQYRWSLEDVQAWLEEPYKNPKTGRTIKVGAKTGIYRDLEKAHKYYLDHNYL